jgi:hypothetical protein
MSWDEGRKQEKKVAVARWADRYTSRFDQALTAAWPDLGERLKEAIGQLSWRELTLGPGKEFNERRIQPAVQSWVERHVQPLVTEAVEDFCGLDLSRPDQVRAEPRANDVSGGGLEVMDVLQVLALPGGGPS